MGPDDKEGFEPNMIVPDWQVINRKFANMTRGGRFTPHNTNSTEKIAIIIPYRDRRVHLKVFLNYMHAFLQRQNVNYVIYVVEMEAEGVYQKGILINAGFLEVTKREDVKCVIIHDVDTLPVYDGLLYSCLQSIRHLVAERQPAILDNFNPRFRSPDSRKSYNAYIGGAIAYPTHHFRTLNGYSNLYSGWGGEDDDMYRRIEYKRIPFVRDGEEFGRFYIFAHVRQPSLKNRLALTNKAASRMDMDGLSSVRYNIKVIEERRLFTWILITTRTPACVYPNFVIKYHNNTKLGYTIRDP